jgi:hypothetical protein
MLNACKIVIPGDNLWIHFMDENRGVSLDQVLRLSEIAEAYVLSEQVTIPVLKPDNMRKKLAVSRTRFSCLDLSLVSFDDIAKYLPEIDLFKNIDLKDHGYELLKAFDEEGRAFVWDIYRERAAQIGLYPLGWTVGS